MWKLSELQKWLKDGIDLFSDLENEVDRTIFMRRKKRFWIKYLIVGLREMYELKLAECDEAEKMLGDGEDKDNRTDEKSKGTYYS